MSVQEFKPIKEGKVREIYDIGENLVMVATDRISCFDVAHYEKREKDMVFVYPAANWINTSQNILQEYFSPLEKEDIKLCVLGLGVQMPLEISAKEFVKSLSEENIRALKIMSEHSVYIGVRGG